MSHRKPAASIEDKVTLFDSMLAYSGICTIEADRITTHVEMSSNEIYIGANQNQTVNNQQIYLFAAVGSGYLLRVRTAQLAHT